CATGRRLPDELPALHLVRPVRGGLPDRGADHDQRLRDRRRQPGEPDLDQGAAARPARAVDGGPAAPDAARRERARLLPARRGRRRLAGGGHRGGHPPGHAARARQGGEGRRARPARRRPGRPGGPARRRPGRPGGPARRRRPGRGPGPAGGAAVSAHLLAASTATATTTSVVFWVLAIVSVAAALGMILSPRAVHCAVLLAVVMLSLAVLYLTAGAPFLAAVQIIVYTGAVLMLFLFVIMIVGVSAADSLRETIRGQRLWAGLAAIALLVLLALVVGHAVIGPAAPALPRYGAANVS